MPLPQPKHRDISRQLLAEISAGKYAPSGRVPSEAQLVARFGVSRPTVARALRDLQSDGLIERRAGSGTFVKEPGRVSRSTRQLGLLVPERSTTEIFEVICGELSSLARAQDFALLFGGSSLSQLGGDLTEANAATMCEQFIEQKVMGVFFAPFESLPTAAESNRGITEMLSQAGIPVVLLDRDLTRFPHRSGFDLVAVDNFAGGFLAAEHVIKLGCNRITFLTHPGHAPSIDARIAGAREALLRHGVSVSEDWIQAGDAENLSFVRTALPEGGRDAVLCANDRTAAYLLRTLEKVGVRVPQELRVVGFDDAPFAGLPGTALTTVHQPCRAIAVTAFRALLERMSEPTLPGRSVLLTPRLVVRETCGAYLPRER